MTLKIPGAALVAACIIAIAAGQSPAPVVDTLKVGPPVGAVAPPIEGLDQFGRKHTLATAAGPRGTMLVFFRSADW